MLVPQVTPIRMVSGCPRHRRVLASVPDAELFSCSGPDGEVCSSAEEAMEPYLQSDGMVFIHAGAATPQPLMQVTGFWA